MAIVMKNGGLQHAASLGNIEASTRANILQATRSYESEDENMGRKKARPHVSGQLPKASVYSKGDIREQYCVTDKQLNSIEPPRREKFFGCWSGRTAPQSFFRVCVGRRAPSDENLADYAPINRYPRYPHSITATDEFIQYDEDHESSYFRRRPTSFLSSGDPKRYTWMPADEESVRLEGPRPICPEYEDYHRGPYVVGSYLPKEYLSQSTEHLASLYRCPAHVGLPPPPPPPAIPPDGVGSAIPRQKHVSFARSHTLTSFDEALGTGAISRLKTTRSQERLIGGKKPIMMTTTANTNQISAQMLSSTQQQQHPHVIPPHILKQQQQHHQSMGMIAAPQEILVVEKLKRGAMKTQATQTEGCLGKKGPNHPLSLSPRTVHRVKMVSQGAQTNGMLNGRKLTKSLSEVGDGRPIVTGQDMSTVSVEDPSKLYEHEFLHRTQSEEPPRSPFEVTPPSLRSFPTQSQPPYADSYSRTSSRLSQIETSRSEPMSSENVLTHSRNSSYQSQDSAPSFTSQASHDSLYNDNMMFVTRRGSHVYSSGGNDGGQKAKEIEPQIHRSRDEYNYAQGFHSLPRKTCIHYRQDEPNTLPRRDVTYAQEELENNPEIHRHDIFTQDAQKPPIHPENQHIQLRRASYAAITPAIHESFRRSSMQPQMQYTQSVTDEQIVHNHNLIDSELKPEKEILIDFKPRVSPKQSPKTRRKLLQKTLSEGEILLENRKKDNIILASASEDDLVTPETQKPQNRGYVYRDAPIKDEGIFLIKKFTMEPEVPAGYRHREAYRNRSISLEETFLDDDDEGEEGEEEEEEEEEEYDGEEGSSREAESNPSSPKGDELMIRVPSTFPSTDSLANDITRDHSDGNWNESQATVLTAEHSPSDSGPSLITPTARRKNLLLQHQQRSSIDTEALELEELMDQGTSLPSLPNATYVHLPPPPTVTISHPILKSPVSHLPTLPVLPTPKIAVTLSDSRTFASGNESPRLPRVLSPAGQRRDLRSLSLQGREIEPLLHFRRKSESPDIKTIGLGMIRSDSGKNNTDISECSTNTDEYITCTDNSRRFDGTGQESQGTKTSSAPSSSSTQVPAQSSTTATQDGSSFESASSMYSLARGETICEDIVLVEEMPLPDIPKPKTPKHEPSPTHSVSSSSSGSYGGGGKELPRQKTSPARVSLPKIKPTIRKPKSGSITDDDHDNDEDDDEDKSEKRYSSSGYYESPHDESELKLARKKQKEWTEDERRRKKGAFKLEIEKNGAKSLTPTVQNKAQIGFKQISPEDRNALNVLDGTSPSKGRRFRSKGKRLQRNRSTASGDDRRGGKTQPLVKSPEPTPTSHASSTSTTTTKLSPSKYSTHKTSARISPSGSPRKISNLKASASPATTTKGPCPEKRLKAISTESLRSVSPGSDSVFYSEADLLAAEHQVHCHHCGKEVEIVTAVESQESIGEVEEERPANIVQPPAGFADSPDQARQPHHRLYKKLDKRFRSEERHADRRYIRSRQDTRAKSEERGKDENTASTSSLRPAGSSPCVGVPDDRDFPLRDQLSNDPDQGIYHGCFRMGKWICINDRDVWRRNDYKQVQEVRFKDRASTLNRCGSTDSEKDFRKKYQAITHRLVHRKSCGEMYRRQSTNSFTARALISPTDQSPECLRRQLEDLLRLMFVVWAREGQALKVVTGEHSDTDKTIVVRRESGEFGFRIHGSKPVVVSAIEPGTPAESSGLEIGDIVVSVNGISVVDKNHSEVVKIAHAGSDTLELEVARTIGILSPNGLDNATPALYSGYLWRQGGQVSGTPSHTQKWIRRWFSLRPDHCVYFYKTETDVQPVGAILLTNHNVEFCATDVGKSFAFCIESEDAPPIYLAADSEEAANRWVAIMSHASKQTDPWLDVSSRNLKLPPNGIIKPDCFGYLMKLGSKWKSWSKRYCVLKDASVYFYHDANSKAATGMACLQGYRVQPSSTVGGRKFTFELTPSEAKLRHFYFSTESEMDKRRWVAALEYSIDRWMKAG